MCIAHKRCRHCQTVEVLVFVVLKRLVEMIAINRTLHKDPKNRTTETPDDQW